MNEFMKKMDEWRTAWTSFLVQDERKIENKIERANVVAFRAKQDFTTRKHNRGQGMVEYGLAVALVALIAIVGLMALGSEVNSAFCKIEQGFSRVSCTYGALSGPVSSASYTSVASGVSSFTAQAVTQFPTNTIIGSSTFIMSDGVGYKVGIVLVDSGRYQQTFIQTTTNDGSTWTTMTSPDETNSGSTTNNSLASVFCTSDTSCVAVGYWKNSVGEDEPLAVSLSGSTWSLISPAYPSGTTDNYFLEAVACSTTTCAAGGEDASTGATFVVTGANLQNLASSTNIGNVTTVGFNPGDNLFWLGA